MPHNSLTRLGHDDIDQDHEHFYQLINRIQVCTNQELAGLFQQLLQLAQPHFDRENHLMQISGFSAQEEHKSEHARLLGELRQFKRGIDRGNQVFARAYLRDRLPQWFELHLQTLDSALVAHLAQQDLS